MIILKKYKALIITCIALILSSTTILIGLDIILFEFTSIRMTYEFGLTFNRSIQLLLLIIGLFYHKIEESNLTLELNKGILITIIYAFFMGELHQMIYPSMEPPTILETLILDLSYSWMIIIVGFGVVSIKYTYHRLKQGNKK